MEVIETDRINIIAEKRKWQMEMENKRRQLEDDKRALQHLKSKALRERWLLDGVPSGGMEHEEVKRQLEQDEERSRALEDTISRLEQELVVLESGGGPTITPAPTVQTELIKEVEVLYVKPESEKAAEVSAVPVVHEMNGEDGGHVLSSFEVEELIHKADEASMKSPTISALTATVTTTTTTVDTTTTTAKKLEEELDETKATDVSVEITGLEAKPEKEPGVSEATEDNPVTMVFMGYQNVEDEDETKKVLGLKGTVKAELVVIDEAEGKTSPVEQRAVEKSAQKAATPAAEKPPSEEEKSPGKKNGETAASAEEEGERAGRETEEGEKKKQPFCLTPLL